MKEKCLVCSKLLKIKQKKYCSLKCQRYIWSHSRSGKSKYTTYADKIKAKREQARRWAKKNYWKNPKESYSKYKKYWTTTSIERKLKRKEKKTQYTKDWRKMFPNKPAEYHRKNKLKWTSGIDCRNREIWSKAESLAKKIIKLEGYKDIFESGFKDFYYDFLGRRKGRIAAFQVTTLRTRLIKRKHIELAKYLGLDFYIVHVKPTFDVLYLTPIDMVVEGKGKQYHYNKGKEFKL